MDSGLLASLIESVHGEGVRLEYVAGMPYWEMMPGARHHDALMRLRRAHKPGRLTGSLSSVRQEPVALNKDL